MESSGVQTLKIEILMEELKTVVVEMNENDLPYETKNVF